MAREGRALVCLDARYGVESGASTIIRHVVPILVTEGTDFDFVVLTHGQFPVPENERTRVELVPFLRPARQILWTQLRLPRLLRSWKVQVYHSIKHIPPFVVPARSIYSSGSAGYFTGDYPSSFLEHVYWRTIARRILRKTDRLIALSDHNRDVYVKVVGLRPDRVRVIGCGIDGKFRPHAAEEARAFLEERYGLRDPFLLCVGNVYPVKNHRVVARALKDLREDPAFPHHLVFIGQDDHPYAEALKRDIREWGLEERVHFLGYVDNDHLPLFYSAALCLIQPSLHEGLGCAPQEAMGCGLPVICSRRGGLVDSCGETALYLEDPDDVEGLAVHIRALAKDESLRSERSRAVRARAETFSWPAVAGSMLDLYRELSRPGA